MKRAIKIISTLLIAVMFVLTLNTVVMAAPNANSIIDNMQNQSVNGTEGVTKVGGQIVSIITTVGIIIAVVVLVILGIKYMIGSASEKAEYKKTMIPYLVGAVIVFAASAITKAIFSIAGGISF